MTFQQRLEQIQQEIKAACLRCGRDPTQVHLLAVSKMQPDELIEEAYNLGVRDFGENYVQELDRKQSLFSHLQGVRWHLIGALQTNKVKTAVAKAQMFHALDSIKLLGEIRKKNDQGSPWPVFIEVNVDGQHSKSGIPVDEVPSFAMQVLETPQVDLRGLMAIPEPKPNIEDMRPAFRTMRDLNTYLEKHCGRKFELSMGMSEDFAVAIEEGAHWIRVGRRLFGERPHR